MDRVIRISMMACLAVGTFVVVAGCSPEEPANESTVEEQDVFYRNCDEAKGPIRRGEPGYRSALDGDRDGTACDSK